MIFFQKFGVHGRWGNQLFQLASLLGFSKKYNAPFTVQPWQYAQYFDSEIPQGHHPAMDIELNEPVFHFTPEWWDVHVQDYKDKNVNITGWLQSFKYFGHCKDDVKRMFKFKQPIIDQVYERYKEAFTKPVIAISIRRGDYVANPNYTLLPIKYYLIALLENFPDFREKYNIIIFTDDFNYARLHFKCLTNVWYADNLADIAPPEVSQLTLGTLADHFIIANSTFSWWMAYLGEGHTSKVIRPTHIFAGELAKTHFTWDHYPEHWIELNHKEKRIDLNNVTFTIPVKFDTKDRKENLDIALKLLLHDFDTNIIVGEQGHHRFKYTEGVCRYVQFQEMERFHRTKMLNDMAAMSRTPIVVNYDADVVIPPLQIVEAANAILNGGVKMCYPYDGAFARVPRKEWMSKINEYSDVGMFGKMVFRGMEPHDAKSVGGCIMWDTQAFMAGGMENENFISYGPEDVERYERFQKLGYMIGRVQGALYHFDHILAADSSITQPFFRANKEELEKIRAMSYDDLLNYVQSWPWSKKYMPSYYESISEDVIKSRDAVFAVLREWGVIDDRTQIVDFGCGLGAWGKDLKRYWGIDFGVPEDKLVIPKDNYIDHDLRIPVPPAFPKKHLALCLEVAEHIEEQYADVLIDSLCGTADTILFSAAIPGQGGVNHFNEQWQSYWIEKFVKRGYWPKSGFRDVTVNNKQIAVWYRQNMILFVKDAEYVPYHPIEQKEFEEFDFIHPQMYLNLMRHHRIMK